MKISTLNRITISIVGLCVAAILISNSLGIIPDERITKTHDRALHCNTLTATISFLMSRHEVDQIVRQLELFQSRQPELISAGLRLNDGLLSAQVGDHAGGWDPNFNNETDGCYVVSINAAQEQLGSLELRYQPVFVGHNRFVSTTLMKLLGLMVPLLAVITTLQLRQILNYVDPSQVVPERVRQTLDNFAEGVVLLDSEDRIVLTNEVFSRYVGLSVKELTGTRLWSLPWDFTDYNGNPLVALRAPSDQSVIVRGSTLRLRDEEGRVTAIFSVNASPVLDDEGRYQGLMATFADITPLERSRDELSKTLVRLEDSKKEVTKQNDELRFLATRDPLTGCINRRTFFEEFERHWDNASANQIPLCGMMVDIDFFKSINDTYGHSMGDEVLRRTGLLLHSVTREEDIVCRYGGEEFSILLPGVDLEEAEATAEEIRSRLSQEQFPGFTITASLGVSAFSLGAEDPQGMLDQADKCLYVAKRNGRNQVVRFDTVPEDLLVDESKISREKPQEEPEPRLPKLPFSAVAALHAAVSFRDVRTGAHCSRVAQLAALMAQRILGPRNVYLIEIAALLHDIGKVGIPDSILLKPGRLTPDEWKSMERHGRIGVEIINRSFKHAGLTEIVQYRNDHFGGESTRRQSRKGNQLPIGSRILAVADAFDSMVSEQPYRERMSVTEALEELHKFSGTQFDPEIVGLLVDVVKSGHSITNTSQSVLHSNEIVLSIGEQIERLMEAAEADDHESFLTLAERLKKTSAQHEVTSLELAATNAIAAVCEDSQLNALVQESFEILSTWREVRAKTAMMGEITADPGASEPMSESLDVVLSS